LGLLKSALFVAAVGGWFLTLPMAIAERKLTEKEILARCYAQLTGQRLAYADALWNELKTKTALQVCVGLITDVQLDPTGYLTQRGNPVHRRVLKQFHDLHRDWFTARWVVGPTTPDAHHGTIDIYDPAEPSLYITRSLFSNQNVHYSSVLRGRFSLKALRDPSNVSATARGGSGNILRATKAFTVGDVLPAQSLPAGILDRAAVTIEPGDGTFTEFGTELLELGEIIGIAPIGAQGAFPGLWSDIYQATANRNPANLIVPQPVHAHYGGGALGTVPFLMMNLGHPSDYVADGAAKLPRRAVAAAFQAFMCNSGPYARASDITPYKVAAGAGVVPFRTADSCLRCHSTLDQGAMTMRNLRNAGSVNGGPPLVSRSAMTIAAYAAAGGVATVAWPAVSTPGYHLTQASGKLFFRSVNGELVDVPVGDLDAYGTALSNTDDFYACAASRYFKYFTGIGVEIFDPQDANNQPLISSLSEADREYRNYVLNLAKELKASGSLKTLITRIMSSPYYKLAGFGR
jgi:hypothetical protein